MARKSEHLVRVGETNAAYYLSFERGLPAALLTALPFPYGDYTSAEDAGWPLAAVIEDKPEQNVVGLLKSALVMSKMVKQSAEQARSIKQTATIGAEVLELYLDNLPKQMAQLATITVLPDRYQVCNDDAGNLSFILASEATG